ncbi:hypothetical protein [Mycobacterium xenopi]|uniref:hypothetical protein n=1 Tax=Mycobacterium xenopi TaxID=1789 RepID=UPI000A161F29|nr:hypothetical protein [Mycobacterium xenopi]ORX21143.1 hypothetical protein AWC32_02130 [Mycobacterium xenopi]SPX94824.1 Uncharacterised protein [Mycobacterium xenopi]
MTGPTESTPVVDRHVVMVTATGSFTAAGERLTGPVDCVDKLEKLIKWSYGRGLLQPIPAVGDGVKPARVWVVGAGCRELISPRPSNRGADRELVELIGESIAPLVSRGWELRRGIGPAFVLARAHGEQRISVEVLAEPRPWLCGDTDDLTENPPELGRRLRRWYTALGALPAAGGALCGAVVNDHIMAARAGRRGAVMPGPGVLPAHVVPEMRVQPPWCAPGQEVEQEFEHSEELVWLTQECPQLASAGTLTFGHGQPQILDAAAATRTAEATKRPFGLWHVTLPAASSLQIPDMLPPPHPQMSPDEPAQAWVTSEDLDGLAKDVRDGGAGLPARQLAIDQAIVWPQQSRILEAWAMRMRQAREQFAADPPLRTLVETAAAHYLDALADPRPWSDETLRHHFQPAWAAAIAARVRLRGRRAAMRISREYRVWPVYARGAAMIYALGRDDATNTPIELSDTHSRLGRMTVTRRARLSDEIILAVLKADTTTEVADALTEALDVDAPDPVAPALGGQVDSTGEAATDDVRGVDAGRGATDTPAGGPSGPGSDRAPKRPAPVKGGRPRRGGGAEVVSGGSPAAVLHTDGLWLADGTRVEVGGPIVHVGQVAELAYKQSIGYRLTPKFSEPGQIWITDAACRGFGIDVEAISRRDRAKSLRQLTDGIDFVTLAVDEGWSLGGAGEEPNAHRLGTWTRVYRDDTRGVMIALIPGMGAGPDEMPILADEPTPAQIARRLKLLADALRFPWKINAGVTAVDLMLQTRPKTWSPQEWRGVVFAPSTTTPPFGIGDVESDFDWSRPPTSEERQRRYVHAYDRGGSYVAGIAGLELPIGDPVHHPDGASFDAKTPGYWLIEIPPPADWRLPYVLNPRGHQFSGPKWVCTPTLERAVALGYQPQIVEAWLWPRHGRVLLGWYERFRDASAALDIDDVDAQAARNQAKIIRTHGIGIIGSDEHLKGKPAYSPERRLHVVAKAKANIVYRIHQIGETTGQWPLAVATDTVLYACDDPDPVTAWPGGPESLGRGFGQYKPEGSALLAEHLEHLNGRDYRGKRDLIPADEWRAALPIAGAGGSR